MKDLMLIYRLEAIGDEGARARIAERWTGEAFGGGCVGWDIRNGVACAARIGEPAAVPSHYGIDMCIGHSIDICGIFHVIRQGKRCLTSPRSPAVYISVALRSRPQPWVVSRERAREQWRG